MDVPVGYLGLGFGLLAALSVILGVELVGHRCGVVQVDVDAVVAGRNLDVVAAVEHALRCGAERGVPGTVEAELDLTGHERRVDPEALRLRVELHDEVVVPAADAVAHDAQLVERQALGERQRAAVEGKAIEALRVDVDIARTAAGDERDGRGLGFGFLGFTVETPVAGVVPAGDTRQLEAVGCFFAEIDHTLVIDLVVEEAEEELRVVVAPAAVVADDPDGRIDALGLRDGHRHRNGLRIDLRIVGADRGADVEHHLRRGVGLDTHVVDELRVDALVGLLGRGAREVREEDHGSLVTDSGFDRVVDLREDAEIGRVPREGLDLTHVFRRDDDLGRQRVENGGYDLLGREDLCFVELLAGDEESRGGCQHGCISCEFHCFNGFKSRYLSVSVPAAAPYPGFWCSSGLEASSDAGMAKIFMWSSKP